MAIKIIIKLHNCDAKTHPFEPLFSLSLFLPLKTKSFDKQLLVIYGFKKSFLNLEQKNWFLKQLGVKFEFLHLETSPIWTEFPHNTFLHSNSLASSNSSVRLQLWWCRIRCKKRKIWITKHRLQVNTWLSFKLIAYNATPIQVSISSKLKQTRNYKTQSTATSCATWASGQIHWAGKIRYSYLHLFHRFNLLTCLLNGTKKEMLYSNQI